MADKEIRSSTRNRYSIGAACLLLLLISGFAWAKSGTPETSQPLDYTCQSNADCVVKDVGNCCGYYPACVNVTAMPDPQAVKAQCVQDGMASICGFKEISSCECVNNHCQSAGSLNAQ